MATQSNDDFLKEIDELLQDAELDPAKEKTESNHHAPPPPDPAAPPKTLSSVDALMVALASHEDLDVIRGLCEGGRVPVELRADVWKECLGVSRRSDALGWWNGPLDCDNQELIHRQCYEEAAKLQSLPQDQAGADMERIITFYCKSRNLRYASDCGWAEILVPLISLGISNADVFNSFYAMMTKYIPRDCRADGRPFHLFRLLLLYHDPELCSFLDTKKLSPDVYLQSWLRSLFASTCELSVTQVMWDHYLLDRDPFLVFFLALVLVINAKELVMEGGGERESMGSTLATLPSQLSADDVNDFFSLAKYYASRTPQSFRKDYYNLLFGSGRSLSTVATNVSHALCLPISLHDVLETSYGESPETTAIQYTVVDCRPIGHFSCGHLPESYHLDANLLLHSPQDFVVAADRLWGRVKKAGLENGEHLCFLGSGREQEDQYVNMVVAKFLQKSIPYVSLARGGFLELTSLLGGRVAKVLEDYDSVRCQELYSEGGFTSSARSDTSDSDSESERRRRYSRGSRLYTQLATGSRERLQRFRTRLKGFWNASRPVDEDRHIQPLDKPVKRYRNVHADIFVIADEDEAESHSANNSDDESSQEMVNISLYSSSSEILHSFPCVEIADTAETFPSQLLLSAHHLILLRELSDRAGWARVKHHHYLESILKITAKKRYPDIITFKFGTGSGSEVIVTHRICCRIPNAQKCTGAVKHLILKLQSRHQQ